MAALVDTNILVYRVDARDARKQRIAAELLRKGLVRDSIRIAHQAVIEFVSAVTKPLGSTSLLTTAEALREAEEMVNQFPILYPNEILLRLAVRGCATYQMNWFDAHMWAYAEYFGLSELLTEDLQHDRVYGTVRVVNPFLA